jgi:hypothetical protein
MKLIHPPGVPPHPWADDVWIFPEDHPLAPLERQARAQQQAKLELKEPPKQLEAGDDPAV